MIRLRTIIFIATVTAIVYLLSPAERKRRVREKLREFGFALTVGLLVYWIFIVCAKTWGWWGGAR